MLDYVGAGPLLDVVSWAWGRPRSFSDGSIPDLVPEGFDTTELHKEIDPDKVVCNDDLVEAHFQTRGIGLSCERLPEPPALPDDWLVYDDVMGVIPLGVQKRWLEASSRIVPLSTLPSSMAGVRVVPARGFPPVRKALKKL